MAKDGVRMRVTGDPIAVRAEVAELLGVSADNVDPGDNLISQGLDSLRMMSLAGRWRKRGVDVEFAALAAEPTIDAWSRLVTAGMGAADADLLVASTSCDGDEPFPLAPMQHAMWVGRQDGQPLGGVAGHLYVEFDGGPIDPERLRQAAAGLARRHPMLRVQFLPDGTQQIDPNRRLPVAVHDLRDFAEHAVHECLDNVRIVKSHQQLDGQVLELTLSLLPGDRARLHVDLDMQAADAMSYRTLMADLAAMYSGEQLTELRYSFQEYRREIARRETGAQPRVDADRQWWSRHVPELPDPPRLPYSTLGTPSRTSTRRWQWFDAASRDALFVNARSRGVTPAVTFAAAFAHTLARWSSTSRFLLNLPLFGREALHPDVDSLVGDFTSSLLLDIDLTQTTDAASRVRTVHEALRIAATHSHYSGLSVLRDMSRHRGCQVLAPVVFTSALGLGELFDGGVTNAFGAPSWILSQGPQVALDAQVTEFDGGVLVNWDVREDVFPAGVIDAMFAHHVDELRRLAASNEAWTTPDLPALPDDQRAVRDTVNSRIAPASGETLHNNFFQLAHRQPDAPAVLAGSGDLSYGQLRDRAFAIAAALRANGIGCGDTVAIVGPKCAEQVAAVLGILAVGGAYLPIGTDQPLDRATRILAAGEVRLALVGGTERIFLPVPTLSIADVLSRPYSEFSCPANDPNALAYVLFTSGSTGEPKGVEVTHDAAMNTLETLSSRFDIGAGDSLLALSALEADMSVLEIFAPLRNGGAVVVVDEADRREPDRWARLIDTHRVTMLNVMPGSLDMLLDASGSDLSSLRAVLVGGDWVRPGQARRLQAASPGVRFAGLGGATETAIHATIFEILFQRGEIVNLSEDAPAVPYGLPLPNIACRVVDGAGDDCPDWVVGELWVSGRGIARGYRGRPDLTARHFVELAGRVWYRTGDSARYRPDGTLEFVGRADHRVKISGYRVELGEVEAALQKVSGVNGAVATIVPAHGSGEILAAVIRARDLNVDQVRTAMAELVPAHMIPQHLLLVDHIPYTLAGKIDRRALAAQLATSVADSSTSEGRAPSTPVEAALAAIIGDVLNVDAVGMDDDFFTLGGDSVLATQTVGRIRAWLDTPDVIVADIFAARTVSALAGLLSGRESDPGRLEQVGELYLEVVGMDAGNVAAAIAGSKAVQ